MEYFIVPNPKLGLGTMKYSQYYGNRGSDVHKPSVLFLFVFSTYPAAQLPLAVPDLLAHSVEV